MREFFSGWKRKLGVLTLIAACVLAAGWVRSLRMYDHVHHEMNRVDTNLASFGGVLQIGRQIYPPQFPLPANPDVFAHLPIEKLYGFGINTDGTRQDFDPWLECQMEWRWDWGGFHFGKGASDRGAGFTSHDEIYIIPYWSLVVPLTLLSAWLLLSKPGPRKRTTATEGQPE